MYICKWKNETIATIPEMEVGRQRRMVEEVYSTIIFCKNVYKCTMYPSTTIIKIKKSWLTNSYSGVLVVKYMGHKVFGSE
jgi:hypothetical protein